MEIINATEMIAGYAMGMNPEARELLVVVVKGTFKIPSADKKTELAEDQQPIVPADNFTGKPGFSAPIYEGDYPPYKPRCDVLLHGSAYAPGGKPAGSVTVGLGIGPIQKSFEVAGNRVWKQGLLGIYPTKPEPFTKMPISYDNAFGGIDNLHPDEKKHRYFLKNHAGRGFYDKSPAKLFIDKPLPNTHEIGKPVTNTNGNYRPMAFGPVGRSWGDRPKLAGTYDKDWLDNVFPFLPDDFQDAYNQSAPPDQQMPYPKGGETVRLVNLTPAGNTSFALPPLDLPVEFSLRNGEKKNMSAIVDTVIIEPDQNRFILCWRATLPLRKNMFEVSQCVVGTMPPGWYRARDLGKTYYRSLKAMVASKDE